MSPGAAKPASRPLRPLVVLDTQQSSFHAYLREIMLSEGFPYCETADINELDSESSIVAIVPHANLTENETDRLFDTLGTERLIVLVRPCSGVRERLGLDVRGEANDPHLAWKESRPIQIHGTADIYGKLQGAKVCANLVERGSPLGPGVLVLNTKVSTIMVTAFNVPETIVLTRQGNPDWINTKGDEWLGAVRPGDLFCRVSGETWVDTSNTDIPQADLLQRFFVDQIITSSPVPLPRVWYFPHMQKVSFTVVADSDSATPQHVQTETDLVCSRGGVYSLYLIDRTLDSMDREQVDSLLELGNEVSIHPNYSRVGDTLRPCEENMRAMYREIVARFESKFKLRPASVRHHALVWCGWVSVPRIEWDFGIGIDNCYGYPPWFGQEKWGGCEVGYLTGSGQPQRFCDIDGSLVEVFQIEQNLEDEILLPEKGLDTSGEEAARLLAAFIERSQEGNFSHVVACFHPITVATNPEARTALENIMSYCKANGVPVRTLKDILAFARLRRTVSFVGFKRDGVDFSYTVRGPEEASQRGVTLLLPAIESHNIEVNGTAVDWPLETIGSHTYRASPLPMTPLRIKYRMRCQESISTG